MGQDLERDRATAKRLIKWSNILAWPAVGILFLGPTLPSTGSTTLSILLSVVLLAMIIIGTILGQKGKNRLKRLGNQ